VKSNWCQCRGQWAGGGHCRVCCHTFSSDTAFDAHREGPYDHTRHCIDIENTPGWRNTARGWTNSKPMPEHVKKARRGA
jgi:hypothetical protein